MSSEREYFERVYHAKGEERKELLEQFVKNHTIKKILETSLESFKTTGEQNRLALAGEMLYTMGEGAFNEVKVAIDAGLEGIEWFAENFTDELEKQADWTVDAATKAVDEMFTAASKTSEQNAVRYRKDGVNIHDQVLELQELRAKVKRLESRGIEGMQHELGELRKENKELRIEVRTATDTLRAMDGSIDALVALRLNLRSE